MLVDDSYAKDRPNPARASTGHPEPAQALVVARTVTGRTDYVVSTGEDSLVCLPFLPAPRDAPSKPAATANPAIGVAAPLQALAAVHSGAPGPLTVAVDAVVLYLVVVAVAGPSHWSTALAVAVALIGSGQVYRDRDRVVARGLAWWPGVLLGPVSVGILADVLLTQHEVARTAAAGALGCAGLFAVRAMCWSLIAGRRRSGRDLAGAIVVGADDRAATLARTLERHPEIGLEFRGHIETSALLEPRRLARAAAAFHAEHVFLVPTEGVPAPASVRRALGVRVHMSYVPMVSDALLDSRPTRRVGGVAVLPLGRPLQGPFGMVGKRGVDVVCGALLLLVTSPLLLLAAIAVRLDDGGPILYRQTRTGMGGQQFRITKLRTMRIGADVEEAGLTAYNTSDGLLFKMRRDPRVTRAGRVLRRTGIDELPQLIDVLRGRMSLVGPRPLPVESSAFSERDSERHLVRPGMTGLWQVSGGSTLRYREMIDLDLAYVHTWGHWLDVQIALATVGVLLRATFGRDGN